jgi:hypothetical protein
VGGIVPRRSYRDDSGTVGLLAADYTDYAD